MGMCHSQKNELKLFLHDELIKNTGIKPLTPIYKKICINNFFQNVSFKTQELTLIENGLLIDNYIINPNDNTEKYYDKRTNEYKKKINEIYLILRKLSYENYIKGVFMTEYKKQIKYK